MTRLLNTAIISRWPVGFGPSRIDMLGGLSMLYILRMPPGFCANAPPPVAIASSSDVAAASPSACRLIACSPVFCHGSAMIDEPRRQAVLVTLRLVAACGVCNPKVRTGMPRGAGLYPRRVFGYIDQ